MSRSLEDPVTSNAAIRGEDVFINGDGSTSRDPAYGDFRAGDVWHSQADVSKARRLLGVEPRVTMLGVRISVGLN